MYDSSIGHLSKYLLPSLRLGLGAEPAALVSNSKSEGIRRLFISSLRVTKGLLPELENISISVSERLRIDRASFDLFVFPNASQLAYCLVNTEPICVGFSSSFVELLDHAELAFVLGHELGHALIPELRGFNPNDACLEDLILARQMEISVDRIGLLACGDQEASFRAIVKSMSGLSSRTIRFDFSSFLNESRAAIHAIAGLEGMWWSHPPLYSRFRALLAFSLSDLHDVDTIGTSKGTPIERVNAEILKELYDSVDEKAEGIISAKIVEFLEILVAYKVKKMLKVSLSSLQKLSGVPIDQDNVKKLVELFSSTEYPESLTEMDNRLSTTALKLREIAPRRFGTLISSLETAGILIGAPLGLRVVADSV